MQTQLNTNHRNISSQKFSEISRSRSDRDRAERSTLSSAWKRLLTASRSRIGRDLGAVCHLVWCSLEKCVQPDGFCWPSESWIGEDTGLSISTVRRAIRKLQAADFLDCRRLTHLDFGYRAPNLYRLAGKISEIPNRMGSKYLLSPKNRANRRETRPPDTKTRINSGSDGGDRSRLTAELPKKELENPLRAEAALSSSSFTPYTPPIGKTDDDDRRRHLKTVRSEASYFERAKRILLTQGKAPEEVEIGLAEIEARRKQTPRSVNYFLDSFCNWEQERDRDRIETEQPSVAAQPGPRQITHEDEWARADEHARLCDAILDVEEVFYRNWLPDNFRETLLRKPTEIHDALAMDEPISLDDVERELRAHDIEVLMLLKSYLDKRILDDVDRESEQEILFDPSRQFAEVYESRLLSKCGLQRMRRGPDVVR